MRAISLFVIILLHVVCNAQSDATFTVSKKKKVMLECRYDSLAGDTRYFFKVYGAGTKDLVVGKFSGGQVWLNDTAVGIHTVNTTSKPQKHTLELYYKKDNSLAYSRSFTVMPNVRIPAHIASTPVINVMPDVVFFSGVYSQGNKTSSRDSLISKVEKLLVQLNPTSRSKSKVDIKLKLTFKCKGQTTYLQTTGLKLSPEMISKINEMETGCYFGVNATYHSYCDPPEDITMGPYRFDVRQ